VCNEIGGDHSNLWLLSVQAERITTLMSAVQFGIIVSLLEKHLILLKSK